MVKEIAIGAGWPEDLVEELKAIRRLPPQHVAIRRLHRLCRALSELDGSPDWLEQWRKADRLRWQEAAHGARRARNARKDFYRTLAIELARSYDAIIIEPLGLAAAAKKIDEQTGERSEFARKARAGRTVAALYELEMAIRWAAAKCGSAVLELTGETATYCSVCGGSAMQSVENSQELDCTNCGARLDRKLNGAAIAWKMANDQREDAVTDFWLNARAARESQVAKKLEKKERILAARRSARTPSDHESTDTSA
ncbi:zinc ribbon domain-containing protein [Denitromonas halophila]|uniref:zinc ribbon domain-containing protein n=1 Tax=Denitromonas halophila TaxID=1629404 RepID=UPI001C922D7C|nr:zinc ribbon domain-containing protein [Denitromonas halophila]